MRIPDDPKEIFNLVSPCTACGFLGLIREIRQLGQDLSSLFRNRRHIDRFRRTNRRELPRAQNALTEKLGMPIKERGTSETETIIIDGSYPK
jgi:hypothetical protein